MPQTPKRIPGERNPTPGADAPMRVAREGWMGGHDYGIARGILTLIDWSKRRRAKKNR